LVVFTSDHGHYLGHHGLRAIGPYHFEDGIRVPLIVRWPGKVPSDTRSQAIQSLVDLPVTFLSAIGVERPRFMSGLDQLPTWKGGSPVRDHTIVEHNNLPGMVEMKTYIEERYKITVFRAFDEGELFDLQTDPNEFHNLWNDPSSTELKAQLLQKFIQAEMAKEILPMPKVSGA
ncbi:MAG: sulfatase family protein, partial [Verrucomicrobiales bacterium]